MCFHTRQTKKATELEARFNAKLENMEAYKVPGAINGFTYPKTPVIADLNKQIIQPFEWGLIPVWSKDDEIKAYTLNAKIETIKEKPSFRNSVNKRCLVIADGFYEWKWLDPKGKSKQKYLIAMPDEGLFAFGGIWSEWVNKETGEIHKTYSIVTTEANELMAEIHNNKKRMPVILTSDIELDWLNGKEIESFAKCNPELVAVEI